MFPHEEDPGRDRIQEIHAKYSRFEEDVLVKLQKLQREEKSLREKYPPATTEEVVGNQDNGPSSLGFCPSARQQQQQQPPPATVDFQSTIKRNKQLKQDLDKTKARFRSRITYSPLEKILERAKQDYLREFENHN